MCLNRRCRNTPESEWVELVLEKADGSIKREWHSETAGVLLTNVAGSEAALESVGQRVWWADEYDAAHPTWEPVGQRRNFQVMVCSKHGEYVYQLGLTYFRDNEGTCGHCQVEGYCMKSAAELEGAPF